jgi:Myelodysplasia-myeloid leukemia factor 1-interacting protein.
MKKIAIGHHIGERAHVLEREQNVHSGDREERQEFINLDEGRVKVDIIFSFLWLLDSRKKHNYYLGFYVDVSCDY